MILFFLVFFFITGLFIGSFLNVVIDRVSRGESFLFGRSHCDFCQHSLSWYDEIPLLSFMILVGKCRYCHKKMGGKYPMIELSTGGLFALNFLLFKSSTPLTLFFSFCVVSISIVIFYTDIWYGIIPDIALLFQAGIALTVFLIQKEMMLPHILGFFFSGIFFLGLWFITKKRGLGFGDVKLAGAIGFLLGTPFLIPSFYIAFLTGAVVALILIIARKKHFKGDTIPFGPFLVFGELITFFWGNQLWHMLLVNIFHL